MAQSNIGPPPGYNQYTEMQDPGEYSYPGDKKGLVPNDGRNDLPPAYPDAGSMATPNWPEGGGYVANQPQIGYPGQPGMQHVQQAAYPVQQGMQHGQAPNANRHTVVVVRPQNNGNDVVKSYVKMRIGICLAIVVFKVIVIAIVLAVFMGNN